MYIIGLAGGYDRRSEQFFNPWQTVGHDSSAVLVEDGIVIAGIEQERLDRIKHSNKFPLEAINFCLKKQNINIYDIDFFIYSWDVNISKDFLLDWIYCMNKDVKKSKYAIPESHEFSKSLFQTHLFNYYNYKIPSEKILFCAHHRAHIISALCMSGFNDCLGVSIDGEGDSNQATVVYSIEGGKIYDISYNTIINSLGYFYLKVVAFLGFNMFDEYKVMGLAPYGDASMYKNLFDTFYALNDNGQFNIHSHIFIYKELRRICLPRKKGEKITQIHKNIAASLQEALEIIVFHVLRYFQKLTKHRNLCLSGGVAHNCALNGKILYSGLFDNIFVQPASSDAGGAIGAALSYYYDYDFAHSHQFADNISGKSVPKSILPKSEITKLNDVYWGTYIGENDDILRELKRWKDFLSFEYQENIEQKTAELLANNHVIGWSQGCSEFGPRAFGNRSIVADPRPEKNKEIINSMVKKREDFRPFAPSVLQENLHDYFEVPDDIRELPYMAFAIKVKDTKRKLLGAITHVDGTARIQTVSKDTNPIYWNLINNFGKLTGVPIVLNTSFNNNAEPIVDSIVDSIVCFLTTQLHYLAIGNYLVSRKKDQGKLDYQFMKYSLPVHISAVKKTSCKFTTFELVSAGCYAIQDTRISKNAYRLLAESYNEDNIDTVVKKITSVEQEQEELLDEILELWSKRLINFRPPNEGLYIDPE